MYTYTLVGDGESLNVELDNDGVFYSVTFYGDSTECDETFTTESFLTPDEVKEYLITQGYMGR